MRSLTVWFGAIILVIGAGVFLIEREYLAQDRQARMRLERAKLLLERADEEGPRKAIDELTALVAQFPESRYAREARYFLAEGYERLGMRDVALAKYRKVLELSLPEELKSRARFRIAKLQVLRNYPDEGINQLLQLLNTTSDRTLRSEIYLELGRFYQRRGQLQDARRNFEHALHENPDNREARAALEHGEADTQPKEGQTDKSGAVKAGEQSAALSAGIAAFNAGDYRRAIHLLAPLTNSPGPESEDALYYVGNAYLKLKNYRKAVHYLNRAVSNAHRTRDEAAYIKKGEAYYLNNQFDRAYRVFHFVRTHYPNGQYAQIAAEWEKEAQRMLAEKEDVVGEVEDKDDELTDSLAEDEDDKDEDAAPKPKRKPAPPKRDELALDDEADLTP
ncbi:MAG: tetratricopeptide repeat protein [Leptospiraceae bacterium]|nr:tetratricopeptide repeat protein [Leptospiraceae bacterium]